MRKRPFAETESIGSNLHVYAAFCGWSGPIDKVGQTESIGSFPDGEPMPGIPCCPYCGSVLYQIDEEQWWEGAEQHEATHPNYLAFLRWKEAQPRCWETLKEAAAAFEAETGKTVQFSL